MSYKTYGLGILANLERERVAHDFMCQVGARSCANGQRAVLQVPPTHAHRPPLPCSLSKALHGTGIFTYIGGGQCRHAMTLKHFAVYIIHSTNCQKPVRSSSVLPAPRERRRSDGCHFLRPAAAFDRKPAPNKLLRETKRTSTGRMHSMYYAGSEFLFLKKAWSTLLRSQESVNTKLTSSLQRNRFRPALIRHLKHLSLSMWTPPKNPSEYSRLAARCASFDLPRRRILESRRDPADAGRNPPGPSVRDRP